MLEQRDGVTRAQIELAIDREGAGDIILLRIPERQAVDDTLYPRTILSHNVAAPVKTHSEIPIAAAAG